MISFEKIKIKNFLSYGNAWTELDFKQGKILVAGANGAGKSTVISDSVSFALFGKPFRKINIPQLINSINQKELMVELYFSVDKDKYQIKRGLKPSKFEIYKNNELIKQEAATKDYQSYLENQILKINHKTFIQVLVLGSAVFTPFMQLPAGSRRGVIDDLLDINVFTTMHRLLKEKIQKNKEETIIIDAKIDSAKKESISQKRLIETLNNKNDDHLISLKKELDSVSSSIIPLENKKEELVKQRDDLVKILFEEHILEDLRVEYNTIKREIKSSLEKIKTITSIETCPTCMQEVTDFHKKDIQQKLVCTHKEKAPILESLQLKIEEQTLLKEKSDEYSREYRRLSELISDVDSNIIMLEKQVDSLHQKIENQKAVSSADLEREKEKLRELAQNALKLIERKNELITEKSIQEVSLGLLKDTGIKASIIKEYLPILNKMINKYLAEFDFFINFILDENFNEQLLSRGRDSASYFSLSEGEKKRVDVAILLAFRHLASLKNSAKIDLLVLDELDSGLDHDSRLKLLELIQGMEDTNVWVVSHSIQNTELEQQFDKVAHVMKKGDFSEIYLK